MYWPGAQPNSRMQNKPQKDASFVDQPTKATNFTETSGRDHRISPDSLTQTTDASTVQETTQPMIVQQYSSIRHLPLATPPVVQVFTTVSQIPIFPCHQTHHCPKIHNKVNLQLALQHQPLWLIIPQGNQVPPQALTNHCNTPHNISIPIFCNHHPHKLVLCYIQVNHLIHKYHHHTSHNMHLLTTLPLAVKLLILQ